MQYVETPIEDAVEIIQSITCPDDKAICPDGTTCCKESDGFYGCCPISEAVCCKDGSRCCPHAMTCCLPFGCCPYNKGVCCKDNTCCPHGSQCIYNDPHGHCVGSNFLPILMGLLEFNNIDPPMEKVQSCA